MSQDNYWNKLMGSVEEAGNYMLSYNEGPDSPTRKILGNFVHDGDTVLDVGSGPSWNMEYFADYGPKIGRYKGVDYASYFTEACNQRLLQKNYSFAEPFETQDCRDLKEPDSSWDVVIIQDCLEHTNGYEVPIREALRVARKRVVVAFWRMQDTPGHINDDGDDGYGAHYDRHDWERFLESTGLTWAWSQIIDIQGKPRDFYVIEKEGDNA